MKMEPVQFCGEVMATDHVEEVSGTNNGRDRVHLDRCPPPGLDSLQGWPRAKILLHQRRRGRTHRPPLLNWRRYQRESLGPAQTLRPPTVRQETGLRELTRSGHELPPKLPVNVGPFNYRNRANARRHGDTVAQRPRSVAGRCASGAQVRWTALGVVPLLRIMLRAMALSNELLAEIVAHRYQRGVSSSAAR